MGLEIAQLRERDRAHIDEMVMRDQRLSAAEAELHMARTERAAT